MKKSVILGTLTVAALGAGAAGAQTLSDVQERGTLNCGVNTGLVGFAAPDANGNWEGFDVAVCRAVAAAVLEDPQAVEFVSTDRQDPLHGAGVRRGRRSVAQHDLDLHP